MEELNLRAFELCFNIETIKILKEQKRENDEIRHILKKEINYSNELIHVLLSITKEFINTLLCGIKYRLSVYTKEELKYLLINENENLTPLIEYLFGEEMKKYDDNIEIFDYDKLNSMMMKSINGTKQDVSKVVYELYNNDFVCASIKKKLWYEFRNHKWEYIEEAYSLDQKIATELVKKYELFLEELKCRPSNRLNETYLNRLIDLTNNIISKLKTRKDRMELINICTNLFYDSSFLQQLDENRSLLCFTNGVYDLDKKIFRAGTPQDYISYSTNNEYIPYNQLNKEILEIFNNLWSTIFVSDEIKEYVLNLLATSLYGGYFNRKYNIWYGSYDTGLNYTINLIKLALGDYIYVMNNDLVSNKKSVVNKIEIELAKTKGKRICIFNQPDNGTRCSTRFVNRLMTDDKLKTQNEIEFTPQFNIILPSVLIPIIRNTKDDMFNHIYVMNFENKVDKISNMNKDITECFLSILINKFVNYKEKELIIPNEVIQYTVSYNNDIFIDYCKEIVGDFKLEEMYQDFSKWYVNKYTDKNMPSIIDLKKYMETTYGKTKNGWNVNSNT